MVKIISNLVTLQEFLEQPETKTASEYINGEIIQKPIPKGRHSRLQGKLCAVLPNLTLTLTVSQIFDWLKMG
jgi:Uma2 family endonuclease